MRMRRMGVAGLLAGGALAGAAMASEGDGGGQNCYEAMWTGIRQYEDPNAKKCDAYTDCPLAVKCYYGRVYLSYGPGTMQDVLCRGYTGGTWSTTEGRCVGGTLTTTTTTEHVMVEKCFDTCM